MFKVTHASILVAISFQLSTANLHAAPVVATESSHTSTAPSDSENVRMNDARKLTTETIEKLEQADYVAFGGIVNISYTDLRGGRTEGEVIYTVKREIYLGTVFAASKPVPQFVTDFQERSFYNLEPAEVEAQLKQEKSLPESRGFYICKEDPNNHTIRLDYLPEGLLEELCAALTTRVEKEANLAFQNLLVRTSFMDSPGLGGTSYDSDLNAVTQSRDCYNLLLRLLKEATIEGQLAALLGMEKLNPEWCEAAIEPYLKMDSTVTVLDGCFLVPKQVSEIAKNIRKGKYNNCLSRSAVYNG